ncbi:MAG: exodeoxyribonuclease V subunit alpha [Propionibacteriaceae bacterium]|jgi:exodeoxyribonuclease V alpha subunit|nr:exodeoxyribonuclease V subunit alpha [Propionibacteriaceae bacterium]
MTAPVHDHGLIARRLAGLYGDSSPVIEQILTLVLAAGDEGSVCLDLDTLDAADEEGQTDVDPTHTCQTHPQLVGTELTDTPLAVLATLPGSPMVTSADSRHVDRPLVLDGRRVYLNRAWCEEDEVARLLLEHARTPVLDHDIAVPTTMPNGEIPDQRKKEAVRVASGCTVSVLAGGPGTGKTLAVAYILDALARHLGRPLDAILTAPTGRAATRLTDVAATLDPAMVRIADSGTLHKVLGIRGANPEHDAESPLAADVVVVDEASMLPQSLFRHLLRALAPSTRLILVGDPDQLASVAPGDILADIVRASGSSGETGTNVSGGTTREPGLDPAGEPDTGRAGDMAPSPRGERGPDAPHSSGNSVSSRTIEEDGSDTVTDVRGTSQFPIGVTILDHNYRSNTALQSLAQAIRSANPDSLMAALRQPTPSISWFDQDVCAPGFRPDISLGVLLDEVQTLGLHMVEAAGRADAKEALRLLGSHRLLAAPREGPSGVHYWAQTIRSAVLGHRHHQERWPVGLPLLVTRNNSTLGLFNGDCGVIVAGASGPMFACGDVDSPRLIAPSLLPDTEPLFASTVHKSQGSEYDTVTLIVPHEDQALLTRRLFYTAVTRAKENLRIVGTEAAIRRAVLQPDTRSTGLADKLRRMVADPA